MKQETLKEADKRFNIFEKGVLKPNRFDFICGFRDGAKWQQKFNDTSQVTRVEVIQHSEPYNGRAYTNYDAKDVEIQLQDDGKTLKIFLK